MPRDGSGVYSKAQASFVAATTIASAAVNSDIDDIVTDLNTPRPLTAGGTGGASQIAGWDGLTAKATDIASASTINLTTATGPRIDITGTTTITAVTLANNTTRIARATGIFILTASASLIVNKSTSVNYTTAVGDLMIFTAEGGVTSVTVIGGGVTFASVAQALAGTSTTLAVNPAGLYYPTGHLFGLTLSNGTDATNDIDIAVGDCRSLDDTANMALASILTKQLDAAWAVGTNAGGLDTGSIANTTYHIWLIKRPDTGVVDALFSTSASAPTMPTNYTLKRRIGSILRESAAIVAFSQNGDEFLRAGTLPLDVNATNPGTSAVTRTLSVPVGIKVSAVFNAMLSNTDNTNPGFVLFSEMDIADGAPSASAAPLGNGPTAETLAGGVTNAGGRYSLRTNTSAQIRSRLSGSSTICVLRIATVGWVDTRGKTA